MTEVTERPSFAGRLYARGDDGYENARRDAIWNGRRPDRFPDLILVAANADDVVAGVKLAKREGMKIGIRSGGHSFSATGVRNGGLLIDLSQFKDIEVDTAGKTAWIGPAVRANELGPRLSEDDLTFPYGGCPTVGLGGYILTGGYGFNGKSLGAAATNLKAFDMVTADGELIRVDADSHPDYFWAARGGGYGFFGVIVRMQLTLHDAPKLITQSMITYSVDDFEEVASWFLDSLDTFDPALMTLVFGHRSPPDFTQNVVSILATTYTDDQERTDQILKPLVEAPIFSKAVFTQIGVPGTLQEAWDQVDLLYPEGHRYLSDTCWIDDRGYAGFVAAAKPAFATLPTTGSHIMMNPWIPYERDDSALSGTTKLPFHIYAVGEDASQDDALQAWIDERMAPVLPFSNGIGKVNDSDLLVRDQSVMSAANAERLEELRRKHDPEGRFHSFLRAGAEG
jgi:hypothetical protein